MRWTRKGIVEEIRRMKSAGTELNYSSVERHHLNLARAAAWHFGNWRGAVEAAGIDYESVGKYRRWNRERVVARIRELHESGADLSWRAVSTRIDPPLAAAALRANAFRNWREAIAAAGIEIESVARYRRWDDEGVVVAVKALQKNGVKMTSKAVQSHDQPLFCAARRRFGSWNEALQRAGIAVQKGRARDAKKQAAPKVPAGSRVLAARKNDESKATTAKELVPKTSAPPTAAVKTTTAKALVGKKSGPETAAVSQNETSRRAVGVSRETAASRTASTRDKTSVAENAKNGAAPNRREKSSSATAKNAAVTATNRAATNRGATSSGAKSQAAPKSREVLKSKVAKTSATTDATGIASSDAKARDEKTPARKPVAAKKSALAREAKNRA